MDWIRSAPTSREVSAASNWSCDSEAMSESAAAVRRSRCSRTESSKSSSRSGTMRICAGSVRATASGGDISTGPGWDVLKRSNRPMAVPHFTHSRSPAKRDRPHGRGSGLVRATDWAESAPARRAPSDVRARRGMPGSRRAGPWPAPDLRESSDHVRDHCPAPRPRPAHLRGAAARQAAAPPRRPHPRRAPGGRGRPRATRPTGPVSSRRTTSSGWSTAPRT